MFYATVFQLMALNEGRLPHNTGRLAHAAFLEIVRSIDPALGHLLHNNQGRQPFTVSPVWSRQPQIRGGDTAWLRITLLDEHLFETVAGYFLWKSGYPLLYIQALNFAVTAAFTTLGSHPRAGAENLLASFPPKQIPSEVTLRFITPTAITKGQHKTFWLAPDAVAIWHNLRRQWGYCGGADPGKDYDDWVRDSVRLVHQDTYTKTLHFDRYPQVGFKGTATFRCLSDDLAAKTLWFQLARFSFYAGIGYKTPMGMGQVQWEAPPHER